MFEHACFLSYVHAEEALMKGFIDDLEHALRSALEPYVGRNAVYRDANRHHAGTMYNEALATAMCKSAAWVLVYVPQYADHEYTRREFRGMVELEERRRALLKDKLPREHGMIVPIVLRGAPPDLIADSRHYADFRKFSTTSVEILRNRDYAEKIDELAEYMYRLFDLGPELIGYEDCSSYHLPLGPPEAMPRPRAGFPGRPS